MITFSSDFSVTVFHTTVTTINRQGGSSIIAAIKWVGSLWNEIIHHPLKFNFTFHGVTDNFTHM